MIRQIGKVENAFKNAHSVRTLKLIGKSRLGSYP